MRTMKLAMISLILSGCSIPKAPIYDLAFKPEPRCRIHCYDYAKQKIVKDKHCGKDFKSGNYPIEHCHGIFGAKKQFVSEEIIPAVKESIEMYRDLQYRCDEY